LPTKTHDNIQHTYYLVQPELRQTFPAKFIIMIRLFTRSADSDSSDTKPRGNAEIRYRAASEFALSTLGLMVILGLLALYLGVGPTDRISPFSVSAILAGAATMVGALLGFLFGIPRTLQGEAIDLSNRTSATGTENRQGVGYRANTNLEQISDWLTKILVGVGLTQLNEIPSALRSLSEALSPGLGSTPGAILLSGGTVIYFSISGFLLAYLWTRLHLPSALRFADLDALGALEEKIEENSRQLTELQEQAQRDALALSLVEQHLESESAEAPVAQETLNLALAKASPSMKINVFYRAHDHRRDHWKLNKPRMEKVIPVFLALIAADSERKYHRNHAQLGYAYKDKSTPDIRKALVELNEAVRIREKEGQRGFGLYEANRAYCQIMLYDELAREHGEDIVREAIRNDIRVAAVSNVGRQMLKGAKEIKAWALQHSSSDLIPNP
jgi:hypothetical protein